MSHWASQYIGKGWDPIGDGDSTFNCWTFVQHVQKRHYGIVLPDVPANAESNISVAHACLEESRLRWEEIQIPQDGCCALMGRSRRPAHVGIWVETKTKAGVLHCASGFGVTHQKRLDLLAAGWGHLKFYRWLGNG